MNGDRTVVDLEPLDLPAEKECLPLTAPLVRPHRVSSSPPSTTLNDTTLIMSPDESLEVYDAEDLILDLQELVKEPQLAGASESYEALPAPLSKQEILQ